MYQTFRLLITATAIAFVGFSASAPADAETMQIKLTDNQVECFIAAQKDLSEASDRMRAAAVFSVHDDLRHQAEFEQIIKRQGFKGLAEYELVSANISLVMAAIDPRTKAFNDPHAAIKEEIENVLADRTIAERQKKRLIVELNEALKSAQPIQFPTNIELVKKNIMRR